MFVAQGLQSAIARPAIGLDASAWLYGLLDSRLQTRGRGGRDPGQANPPDLATICFSRNQYQSLADSTAPALTRLWPADEGLVDLYHPGQTLPARPHHCPAQLVQPVPSRPITTETQYPLQFLLTPFFVWAALRFGSREAATAILLAGGLVLSGLTALWTTAVLYYLVS